VSPVPALLVTALCTIGAAALATIGHRAIDELGARLDATALAQAAQSYDRLVDQQRKALLSEVTVLAEDTRVRATVMTPNFDRATVVDVLDDLRKTAGASLLAVLDVGGKVRAVSGPQTLDAIDLGGTTAVRAAVEGSASDVWTVAGQVLVVGIAPIRSGPDTTALFMMGFEIGAQELAGIEQALGVKSAVLVGDAVSATSNKGEASLPLLARAAAHADPGDEQAHPIQVGDARSMARVTRTSPSAAAAKIVWLVPAHRHIPRIGLLRVTIWIAPLFVLITGLLVLLSIRARQATS
jgi:hypothetical protein